MRLCLIFSLLFLHDPFEGTLGASIPRHVIYYLQNATYNMIGFGNIIKPVLKGQKVWVVGVLALGETGRFMK